MLLNGLAGAPLLAICCKVDVSITGTQPVHGSACFPVVHYVEGTVDDLTKLHWNESLPTPLVFGADNIQLYNVRLQDSVLQILDRSQPNKDKEEL